MIVVQNVRQKDVIALRTIEYVVLLVIRITLNVKINSNLFRLSNQLVFNVIVRPNA